MMIHPNQYYHVFNRGNDRKQIFFEEENYLFFLKRLGEYLKKYKPTLICYCLMPNHFHLLMYEHSGKGIQGCIHALQTSYAKAVNKRYGKIGHLFQDTYKKILVKDNNQLLHLSRYIHLNPVEADLSKMPEEWPYSSFQEYIGLRNGNLLKTDIISSQFQDKESYCKFVIDTVNNKDLGDLTLE